MIAADLKNNYLLVLYLLAMPFPNIAIIELTGRGVRLDWIIITLMGFSVFLHFCTRRVTIPQNRILVALMLVNLSVIASYYVPYVSGTNECRIDYFTAWVQFLLCNILFIYCFTKKLNLSEIQRLLKIILIVQAAVATFGLIQIIGSYFGIDLRIPNLNPGRLNSGSGYEELLGPVNRAFGTFNEPRQLGSFLISGFVILTSAFLMDYPIFRCKKHQMAIYLLIFAGALVTMSLSTYVMLGFLFIVMSVYIHNSRVLKIASYVLLATAIFYIVDKSFLNSIIFEYFTKRFSAIDLHLYMEQFKYQIYDAKGGALLYPTAFKEDINIWLSSPLVGVGLNNENYYKVFSGGSWSFFAILSNTGLLGVASFIFLYYCIIVKHIRYVKKEHNKHLKAIAQISLFLILGQICSSFVSGGFCTTLFWTNLSLTVLIISNLDRKVIVKNIRTIQLQPNNMICVQE